MRTADHRDVRHRPARSSPSATAATSWPRSARPAGWACSAPSPTRPSGLEVDLAWIEAEIGDRPYGVDLIVPAKYAGVRRGRAVASTTCKSLIPAEHVAFVNDILRRYDVPELPEDGGARSASGGPVRDTGSGMIFSAERRRARSSRSPSRTAPRWSSTRSARRPPT